MTNIFAPHPSRHPEERSVSKDARGFREPETLLSIQYLRGLAALSVAVFHATQWVSLRFDVGAGGVDVFFVISGFVMWTTVQHHPISPLEFLRRRVIRIVPLYWIGTLAAAAFAIWLPGLIPHAQATWPHVIKSLLFIPHLSPDGLPFPMLGAGWTLDYEAFFYVLFAAALLLPRRFRLGAMTAALASVMIYGFSHPPAYLLLANPMLMEFAAGLWLAEARLRKLLPGSAMGWGLIAGGVAIFAVLQGEFDRLSLWRPLLWGFPALMMVTGALAIERAGKLFRSRVLTLLGDASYSIYLCHAPVLDAVGRVFHTHSSLAFLSLAVPAPIAVGIACHLWVEKPLLALFRSRPRPPIETPVPVLAGE